MRVCPACGIVAPSQAERCAGCGVVIAQLPAVEAAATVDAMWVRVECTYRCPGCGADTPLDHLELEPKVECGRCGQIRALDPASWGPAIRHAHDVADLGRPVHAATTLGRYNPYAFLTLTSPFALGEGAAPPDAATAPVTVARVRAAPGHPPCAACHAPLTALSSGGGHLTTQCPRCGEAAMYANRPGLYAPLQAVLAEEQRVDRPAAKVEAAMWSAPVTLRCGSCNTALQPVAGQPQVQCGYCRTVSRIPDRARRRVFNDLTARPWWILFSDRSPTRDALEGIAAAIDQRSPQSAPWRSVLGGKAIGRGMVGILLGLVALVAAAAITAITWSGVPTELDGWALFAASGVLLPLFGVVFSVSGLVTLLGWRRLARVGEVIAIEVRRAEGRSVSYLSLANVTGTEQERRAKSFSEERIAPGKRWLAAVDPSTPAGRMHLLEPIEWFTLPLRRVR
jgi:hypothetical protein